MKSVKSLYRRFESRQFAEEFCRGRILITTLQRCRKIEDDTRRDEEEGEYRYRSGRIHPVDSDYRSRLMRAGYDPDTHPGMIINDCEISHSIRDAWLLCMSGRGVGPGAEKFGEYLVKIEEPIEFFSELSCQLFGMGLTTQCLLGPIVYAQRTQEPEALPIAPAPFIKPPKFQEEVEYRMAWMHDNSIEMVPLVIEFGRVQRHLTLL